MDAAAGSWRFDGPTATKLIKFGGIEHLTVQGGRGGNTFDVVGLVTTARRWTRPSLGGLGNDTFRLSPTAHNLDSLGDVGARQRRRREQQPESTTRTTPPRRPTSINDTLVTRGATQVISSAIDNLSILGGSGTNTYNVEKTFAARPWASPGGPATTRSASARRRTAWPTSPGY